MSSVTIDLGPVGEAWEDPDLDRRPVTSSRGWGVLAGLACLAMLASAAPLPVRPVELTRLPLGLGNYQLIDSTLFLMGMVRGMSQVSAVDAHDGALRWRFQPGGRMVFAGVSISGDQAVLGADPCVAGATGFSIALDLASGAERWRVRGWAIPTPPEAPTVVVIEASWSDRCTAMTSGAPLTGTVQWRGVDRASGATRWTYEATRGARVAVDQTPGGARWAALQSQDRVIVVDLLTGERSEPVTGVASSLDNMFAAAGDRLFVARWNTRAGIVPTISAFDRVTLEPRWNARLPALSGPSRDRADALTVRPCADLVCVRADQTWALDAASGEVRWHTSRLVFADVPGGLRALPASTDGPGVFMHDPRTGRLTTSLPSWRLLAADPLRQRLLIGQYDGVTTLLAWLQAGSPHALAPVVGRIDVCQLAGRRLACRTNLDEIVLLRIAHSRPPGGTSSVRWLQ